VWELAVGHGTVDQAVFSLAGLEQYTASEEKWIGSAIDVGGAAGMKALGTGDIVEAGGVHVQAQIAMGGRDLDILHAAGDLKVPFRFHLGGGTVVDDMIGTEDVIAVVEDDVPGEGNGVAGGGEVVVFPEKGKTGGRLRLRLGEGNELLARVVGQLGSRNRGWLVG
jgi:hypothetical protein